MKIKNYILLLLCVYSLTGAAQQNLTYVECIEKVLKNNYSILLVKKQQEVSIVNNHVGAAGMLPTLNLNGNGSLSNVDTRQEFSNGLVVDKSGVANSGINAGVFLNWTIFDGFRMFALKSQLQNEADYSGLQLKNQIEQSTLEAAQWYYRIMSADELIKGLQADLELCALQLKLAEKRVEIGSGEYRSILLAKTEYNRVKSTIIQQEKVLIDYWKNLCFLMKEEYTKQYQIPTDYAFKNPIEFNEAIEKMSQQNIEIGLIGNRIVAQQQKIRELKSVYYPSIGVNAQYQFIRNQNAAGFALLNQNLGFTAGVTLNWNLFNGFSSSRKITAAKITLEYNTLQQEQASFKNKVELQTLYEKWKKDNEVLQLEEEAMTWAKKHLDITRERMTGGLGNDLEVKQSQNNYEDVLVRRSTALYNKKLTELSIDRVLGVLNQKQ